jgi:AAA family ATP:ADP antiporter
VRPGREMLYTVVAPEAKYKAKNFNDTVVYRGADAVSGWVKTGVDLLAQQPAIAALLGALIALAWAATGAGLARAQSRYARTAAIVDPISDAVVPFTGSSDKG